MRNLYYGSWHRRLAGHVRHSLQGKVPALAHHVSWARYGVPTSLVELGVPIIFGPVGGAETVPRSFLQELTFRARIAAGVKRGFLQLLEFNKSLSKSLGSMSLNIACTTMTRVEIRKLAPDVPCELEPLLTIDKVSGETWNGQSRRLVTSGRLLGWKGFWMVIEAFYRSSDHWNELVIAGDGKDRENLEALATRLEKPGKKVIFTGHISRPEMDEMIRTSAVFCFGSLHDSGGFSVLEAMAAGLPIVCLDAGGPAVVVDEASGIKIPVTNRAKAVEEMAKALTLLAEDSEILRNYSEGALKRAEDLTVKNVRRRRLTTYQKVLVPD